VTTRCEPIDKLVLNPRKNDVQETAAV